MSSSATGAVAYPEMRRFGCPQSFSTGVIAAGGTHRCDAAAVDRAGGLRDPDPAGIGKLFVAGILPGLLAMGTRVPTTTQVPQQLTVFLTGLGVGRYRVLVLIMLMYLVPGCLMDAMAKIVLTVPIVFPAVTALGFDPIWFGIVIVMTVEPGLIHAPVGMNVVVIESVAKEVSFTALFKDVLPYVATGILRLIILIAFPIIALWLRRRMG